VIEIRECATAADELLSHEIYNAVWPHAALTVEEGQSFKASLRESFDFIALDDGIAVGSSAGGIRPQRRDRVFVLVTVLADRRGRGTGSALYSRASEWAAERGVSKLETWIDEDDEESIAFAERRGFVEVERDSRLVLDLAGVEPPPVDPPPGIEVVTWAERPDVIRGVYEVASEGYPDIPGGEDEQMEPFEDWLEHDMQGPSDRPDATFLALADGEVIGYAKFSLTAARPTIASHDMTAVRRSWRGRGVAGALKRAQIGWAKREGFERLQTTNEVRNEPIRRLNERLGYHVVPGRVFFLGPLAR
jgi:GNAT superfamily N-acetyltransferase